MSTPRNHKYFSAMPNQLRRLGGYKVDFTTAVRWSGRVDDAAGAFHGFDAAVIDLTASVWAADSLRFIVIAEPAGDQNRTAAMRTQSHAESHYLDGSSRFHVAMETPPDWIGDLVKYQRLVQQHILGQLGSPMKFWFSANTVEPTVKGVNGAGATSATAEADWTIPYGMVYPGGV